jgi:cellulose synthase operon protein C
MRNAERPMTACDVGLPSMAMRVEGLPVQAVRGATGQDKTVTASRRASPSMASLASLMLALCGAMALGGCSSVKPPPGDDAPTLASLAGRQVTVTPDAGPPPDAARAVAAYRAFLAAAPAQTPQRAAALRRLADLEMDLAEQRAGDGAAPDYRAAVAQYQAWLVSQPDAADRDAVLYQLARAQDQGGDAAAALATLDRLVAAHPTSGHRDEAEFRRGELLFAARRWAEAEAAYTTVLQAGAGSPWLDRALYMQGWSRYRQGRWNDALDALFGVLDLKLGGHDGQSLPRVDRQALPRAEQELVDDSLRVIALSLEQLQGAAGIDTHLRSARRQAYAWRVYGTLAALYQRQGRARDAADAHQRFARSQPLSPRAAWARQQVVQIHDQAGFSALALQAREDFVLAHAPNGDWARAQVVQDGEALPAAVGATASPLALDAEPGREASRAQADRWWRQHVDTLARHHHAQAQRTHAAAEVDAAQRWYRIAIDQVDDDQRGQRRFLLAELLFDAGRWDAALPAYEAAATGDADHPRRADAGYAALLTRQRLLEQADAAARPVLQRAQVDAAQGFVQRFGTDARVAGVLASAAELQWALHDGPAAQALARQALARLDAAGPPLSPASNAAPTSPPAAGSTAAAATDDSGVAIRRRVLVVLADVALAGGDLREAEQAQQQVLALLPATDEAGRARQADRLAAVIYRQGEAARDAGQPADAARHFARVGVVAPGSAAAPAALYDGALQSLALKDWLAAAVALETLRSRHPTHALSRQAAPQLALAYAESGRTAQAAGELERWASQLDDATAARDARWQAAQWFDRAEVPTRAAGLYRQLQQDASLPLPQVVQARWRLAEMARVAGQAQDEQRWLQALQQADADGGAARTERSRTLAALATLRLAEPLRSAYQRVALVEPLKTTLARKKTRFDAVQARYAEAAAAGTAEAQAAATVHSAALYQDFGQAVLHSQRPRGLKKAQAESYQVLLEEQAFPFEERAVDLHQLNAERTRDGQFDAWVRQSYAALATLRPVRWGKREWVPQAGDPQAEALRAGLAHREAGRFDDARRAYEQVLAANPAHAGARLNLAILHDLYLHDPAQALQHYRALPRDAAVAELRELPRWLAELESRLPRQAAVTLPEPRR